SRASTSRRGTSGRGCPKATRSTAWCRRRWSVPSPNAASTIVIDDDRRGCCLTGAPVVLRRVAVAAAAASAKKGEDIIALDVGDIISITDAFVITSATNTRHVRTIVDEIEKAMKEHASTPPTSVEGLDDATWVLLDYGDIVVHVFLDETRAYYELERLWAAAPRDDGHVAGIGDSPGDPAVEAGRGAVTVDAVDDDLARAQLLAATDPLERVEAGRFASAVDEHLVSRRDAGPSSHLLHLRAE